MAKRKVRKRKSKWLIYPLLLVFVGVVWINTRQSFAKKEPAAPPFETVGPAEHTYEWDKLTLDEKGRRQYTAADGSVAKVGIDVSSHQGDIDWPAVAADGISSVFVRVGSRGYESGEIYQDDRFHQNVQGAQAAGLPCGVYFYSQAVTAEEAQQEADFVLEAVREYSLELPIVMDYEEVLKSTARTANLTTQARTDNAIAFCERIRAAGHPVMLYSTRSMLLNHFDLTRLLDYPLWVAEYNETTQFPYEFVAWQYTDRGRVAGIGPDVDLNLIF